MEKLPTVEELLLNEIEKFSSPLTNEGLQLLVHNVAIEFAKLHVEAALKEASEKARLAKAFNYGSYNESEAKFKPTHLTVFIKEEYGHGDSGYVAVKTDVESILNSYSLDNIK